MHMCRRSLILAPCMCSSEYILKKIRKQAGKFVLPNHQPPNGKIPVTLLITTCLGYLGPSPIFGLLFVTSSLEHMYSIVSHSILVIGSSLTGLVSGSRFLSLVKSWAYTQGPSAVNASTLLNALLCIIVPCGSLLLIAFQRH